MIVSNQSILDGQIYEMDLPITEEEYLTYQIFGHQFLVQDMFPNLSNGQRELLLNGITPEKWKEHFGTCPHQTE